jgi:hypothetical protein
MGEPREGVERPKNEPHKWPLVRYFKTADDPPPSIKSFLHLRQASRRHADKFHWGRSNPSCEYRGDSIQIDANRRGIDLRLSLLRRRRRKSNNGSSDMAARFATTVSNLSPVASIQ